MQLERAPVKRTPLDDQALPADLARVAATLILLGAACQIFRLLMPWVEKAVFSISLAKVDFEVASVLLTALAVVAVIVLVLLVLDLLGSSRKRTRTRPTSIRPPSALSARSSA